MFYDKKKADTQLIKILDKVKHIPNEERRDALINIITYFIDISNIEMLETNMIPEII